MRLDEEDPYVVRRPGRSVRVPVRGLHYHLTVWGDASLITPERPALVLCHGYMDVGASFQFMVDELAVLEGEQRYIVAPDWRGFGGTAGPACDQYWFPDYLGDLDALLGSAPLARPPGARIDLLGHSMGGNVVMSYAGVRPQHIRRLINLEGFGLPRTEPDRAPEHLARWLDALQAPQSLASYATLAEVAQRLRKNNPRLPAQRAAWLAAHWSQAGADGRWHILGDPAHKRISALPYRVDETLAAWRRIAAPVLWVEGDETDLSGWWGDRYPRSDFDARLAEVPQVQRERLSPAGHMLHHDQPAALARALLAFLAAG
jgi:pimeloyl-ACP methyl ester carboxylesterase